MQNCRCGSSPSCHEVKKPGPNRGKWYWKCPTGTCRYFKWDDSALPFIQHPREAYEAAAPLSNIIRRPLSLPFGYLRNKSQGLSRTTVKIVFNLVSPTRIGIRVQKNMTIEPIIASIKDIVWDEQLDQWTIPATLSNYKEAMQALPTGFPNILLEIDGIPDTILQSLFSPEQPIDDPNEMTEVESRYLDFVESPMYRQINQFQRDAVRKGIERHGRILYGNENGLGTSKQTLALASVYQDEWPVLLTCPSVLCDTWKEHVQEFFGLDDGQVCVLDYVSSGLFKTKSAVHSNKRRKVVRVKSEPVLETISSFRSTPSPSKPNARFRKSYKQKMKERIENDYFSDSDSEAEEPEEMGVEYEPRKNVKFYIASHKKISNNKSKIYEQHFKVMICDGSNYLKFKDQDQCKNICRLLAMCKRAILLSDTAMYSLPVDLYPQITAVDKKWFPEMDTYIQRYCNPKSTVFGWTWNGRSNMEELHHLLASHIWHCPKLVEIKPELNDVVRQKVTMTLDKKARNEFLVHFAEFGTGEHELTKFIRENDLIKKTNQAKKNLIKQYVEYVFDTYKRPKITIAYYDNDTAKEIEEILRKRKMKYMHINDLQDPSNKATDYDQSNAVQVLLLNLNLTELDIYFESVDLLIVVDLPTTLQKLEEIESYFKLRDRATSLIIRYLYSPDTMDKYLWPLLQLPEV